MRIDTFLLGLYVLLILTAWVSFWVYERKRRVFLRKVSPIYKAHLGFGWEPMTWRDRIFYPLDSYKLRKVKENFSLVPVEMHLRYQNLMRIRLFSFVCVGLSLVIVFLGYKIVALGKG